MIRIQVQFIFVRKCKRSLNCYYLKAKFKKRVFENSSDYKIINQIDDETTIIDQVILDKYYNLLENNDGYLKDLENYKKNINN